MRGISGSAPRARQAYYEQSSHKQATKTNNLNLQRRFGTITKIHDTQKNLVKIQYLHGKTKGGFVGSGDGIWVPVEGGGILEAIIGTPQPGMMVIVDYAGETDRSAFARIIDRETASPYHRVLPLNSKQIAMYSILSPS